MKLPNKFFRPASRACVCDKNLTGKGGDEEVAGLRSVGGTFESFLLNGERTSNRPSASGSLQEPGMRMTSMLRAGQTITG